jgi:hypothetical protein
MSTVTVVYHHEEGSWWAESDDLPGFSAVGSSFDEVERLVREAVHDESVIPAPVDLVEELDDGSLIIKEAAVLPFSGARLASSDAAGVEAAQTEADWRELAAV